MKRRILEMLGQIKDHAMVFVLTLTDTLHRVYCLRDIVVYKSDYTDQIDHTEELMLLEKVGQLLLSICTRDSRIETI